MCAGFSPLSRFDWFDLLQHLLVPRVFPKVCPTPRDRLLLVRLHGHHAWKVSLPKWKWKWKCWAGIIWTCMATIPSLAPFSYLWGTSLFRCRHQPLLQCTMWLWLEIRDFQVLTSKGLVFAQFWSKSNNSRSDWGQVNSSIAKEKEESN